MRQHARTGSRMLAGIRRWVVIGISLIALAACGDSSQETIAPESVPTRTLVPSTPTPTPVPVDLTPTPTDLPAPSALVYDASPVDGAVVPPAAQAWIDRAVADLITGHNADPADIRLIGLEAFTWTDAVLGCSTNHDPGLTLPDPIPGYRLLFAIRNRAYIYHTGETAETDTLLLCDNPNWLVLEGSPLVIDPIAGEMVALVERDIA
ncbi:MAG: hypothetical protein JXQ72_12085, partial [Anaerolineae bacterium]|nr:hypothetical protein [Anaerolineae bacterium]